MNKIGVRLHDLGKHSPYQIVNVSKHYGFSGAQLVLKKALPYDNPFDFVDTIQDAFKQIDIPLLGAYFNPVHPDKKIVENGIENFKKHLDISRVLGAEFVGTETGSKMGSPWGYVKDNHLIKTRKELIPIIQDLAAYGKSKQTSIAIEGAYAHVAYSPKILREILNAVNCENVKVIVDLYNYLNIDNYKSRNEIFEACFQYLKEDIVIFHLKDFIEKDGTLVQVGLGQGLMDFSYILNRIKQETPDAYLIFEGVKQKDVITSLNHIRNLM